MEAVRNNEDWNLVDPSDDSVRDTMPARKLWELLLETRAGLEEALKLPSFQLNVRNQGVNKYLVAILVAQLVTNIALIAILWTKLG